MHRLTPLAPLLLTATALAQELPGADPRLSLELSPVLAGLDTTLRIRGTLPGAAGQLLLGLQSQATPSPLGGIPSLALPLTASLIPFTLDGSSSLDLVVPIPPAGLPSGLQVRAQAVAATPTGLLVASNAAATTFQPGDPGSFLTPAQTLLPPAALGSAPYGVHAADLDLDGLPELLVEVGGALEYWDNVPGFGGTTLVHDPLAFLALPTLGSGLALGDVTGDGLVDLVTGPLDDGAGGQVVGRILAGDGQGGLVHAADLPPITGTCSELLLVDLDLDGDLDLFLAMGSDAHTGAGGVGDRLLWNDGQAGFTEDLAYTSAPFNQGQVGTSAVAAGDLNQDGIPELVLGKTDILGLVGDVGEQNRLVYVFGPGSFFDLTTMSLPARSDNTNDLTLVDVDLDGDLDLVCANTRSSISAADSGDLLINQGGAQGGSPGSFLDVEDPALEQVAGQVIRLGVTAFDADNDGDADLIFSVHDLPPSSTQPLYLNQGGAQGGIAGSFGLAAWFDPGDLIVDDVLATDLDVDGDLDLLLPSTGSLNGDPKGSDMHLHLGTTAL